MRVLFTAMPGVGHALPLVPLAEAFAHQGHDARLLTGGPAMAVVAESPVPCLDLTAYLRAPASSETGSDGAPNPMAAALDLVVDAHLALFEQWRPDLVIYDGANAGAAVAADLAGIAAVVFSVGAFAPFVVAMDRMARALQAGRWAAPARPVPDRALLAAAVLDPLPEPWADVSVPGRIPVRPDPWSPPSAVVPDWPAAAADALRVLVTAGTVVTGLDAGVPALAGALAAAGCSVLVAAGAQQDLSGWTDRPAGGHLVAGFVANDRVVPTADVVVHHGGTGTSLVALWAGVPQVVLPQDSDQFANASALVRLGVAVAPSDAGDAEAVAAAAVRIAGRDSPEHVAAARMAATIAAMPAPAEVAGELARRFTGHSDDVTAVQ